MGEDRRCPNCGTSGAVSRGLRLYQCKSCRKKFNAATGTPFAGLHRKERWLEFGTCLAEGKTVCASAGHCGLAINTAFRCRHRFLAAESRNPRKLAGIVEADETYVQESRKGERRLDRKACRRSSMTVSVVLPAVNADVLREVIEPVAGEDFVLVGDGHCAYPRCAAAIGVRHEALNLSGGERVRDAFHIQTVNSRHGQLKGFLRRYRGIATKYFDNYLRWFQQVVLNNASPRTCLANAINRSCTRFVY